MLVPRRVNPSYPFIYVRPFIYIGVTTLLEVTWISWIFKGQDAKKCGPNDLVHSGRQEYQWVPSHTPIDSLIQKLKRWGWDAGETAFPPAEVRSRPFWITRENGGTKTLEGWGPLNFWTPYTPYILYIYIHIYLIEWVFLVSQSPFKRAPTRFSTARENLHPKANHQISLCM